MYAFLFTRYKTLVNSLVRFPKFCNLWIKIRTAHFLWINVYIYIYIYIYIIRHWIRTHLGNNFHTLVLELQCVDIFCPGLANIRKCCVHINNYYGYVAFHSFLFCFFFFYFYWFYLISHRRLWLTAFPNAEKGVENKPRSGFFTNFALPWKCGETLSWAFDLCVLSLSQRREPRYKIVKIFAN